MAGSFLNRWLVFAAIVSSGLTNAVRLQSEFQGFSERRPLSRSASAVLPLNIQTLLDLLHYKLRSHPPTDSSKRSCNGFPCMYTHLGAKAGRQAMMRSLMSMIHDCAHNPLCSPGKRRRRSPKAVVPVLGLHHGTS